MTEEPAAYSILSKLVSRWQTLAKEGKLKESVVEDIMTYDYVTFVELQHKFQPFVETKDGYNIESIKGQTSFSGRV